MFGIEKQAMIDLEVNSEDIKSMDDQERIGAAQASEKYISLQEKNKTKVSSKRKSEKIRKEPLH